jgi:Flp pilus assembly pilin Flp
MRLRESSRAEEEIRMMALLKMSSNLKIVQDTRGQDLAEYALVAGLVAAACAATLPNIALSIVTVLTKVVLMLTSVGTTAPSS